MDGPGERTWVALQRGALMRFRGMASGVRWWQRGSLGMVPQGASAIGAPSTRLSLGGLHACRARLRFTWRLKATTRRLPGKKTRKSDTVMQPVAEKLR
jgi:hypothetical protein